MPRGDFKIPNFAGGINKALDYSLIKVNEASDAQNVNIDNGVFSVVSGISQSSIGAVLPTNINVGSIGAYYKDNIGYLIVAANGSIYKLNGGSWSVIGSGFSNNDWDMLNYNYNSQDVLILCNGVDNTKIYDGATLRDLKFDPNNASSKAPKGKFITLHYERIWMADDNTLYASKDLNPDDWTTPITPETEVNIHGVELPLNTFDGSKVTGLNVIFDDLIIYKEKSIIKIFGSDPSNYQRVDFSPKGGISDRSIANYEQGTFFIDKSGIYQYGGTNVTLVSHNLGNLFDTLDKSLLNKSPGIVWKNKYIVAVPESGNSTNNLIIEYDFINKNLMLRRGITIKQFAISNDKLLVITQSDNKIFDYNYGTTYNGTLINSFWETGYSDLGMPEAQKEMDMFYFTGSGNGDVKFTITTERGNKVIQKTLNSTEQVYPTNISFLGRLMKLRIENVNGSNIKIKNPKIVFDIDSD